MTKHFHYGSGKHGCLYDNGPHTALRYRDAVESLAFMFELTEWRRQELYYNAYLELDLHNDGAEYCEITACNEPCDLRELAL